MPQKMISWINFYYCKFKTKARFQTKCLASYYREGRILRHRLISHSYYNSTSRTSNSFQQKSCKRQRLNRWSSTISFSNRSQIRWRERKLQRKHLQSISKFQTAKVCLSHMVLLSLLRLLTICEIPWGRYRIKWNRMDQLLVRYL